MEIEQKVIYKVFARSGEYLGLLPNPSEPFNYSQDINTGAADMILHIPQDIDNAEEDPDVLTDEAGALLTDEQGALLTMDRATDIVSTSGSGALIANDNDVQAWGFSDHHPNGVLIFAGYISRWRGIVGSENDIEVMLTSYGKDLVDYIYGNISTVLRISQTNTGDDFGFWGDRRYGETFKTAINQTGISKVTLKLQRNSFNRTVTVRIWNNPTEATIGGTPLGSASVTVTNTGSYIDYDFIFATQIPVSGNTNYFLSVETDSGAIFGDVTTWVGFDAGATNPYADGDLYSSNSGGAWSIASTTDMYFKIYEDTLETDATFTAMDPSDMIREALDGYNAQGGVVTYTIDSIQDTGLSLDYEFKMATVAEIISKARELSPSNWYWYVDPATQVLYFKELQ